MKVTAEIRAELARKKMSYAQIAEKIGTTRQNVWRILSDDKRRLKDQELKEFADILNIPAWVLMKRAEENDQEGKLA